MMDLTNLLSDINDDNNLLTFLFESLQNEIDIYIFKKKSLILSL